MMQEALQKIVAPVLANKSKLALVIGILEQGEMQVFGYGVLNKQHAIRPSEASVFEIGSISKVFTSTLLALMVQEGQLTLDTPVKDLLPECRHLPTEITPRSLATHTSGLPRLPSNFIWSYLKHPRNPYAAYGERQLLRYLAHYRSDPKAANKHTYQYSNLGAGLLGYILARQAGTTYEQLVQARICQPLHMLDTGVALSLEQRERLATPHTAGGHKTSHWDLAVLVGAGGLRSTASDLLTFLKANLAEKRTPLIDAMRMCHEIQVEEPASHINGIGLAWHIDTNSAQGYRICWHNGATGGYQSYMGFVKESRTGVVVLANYGINMRDSFGDGIGIRVLRLLNGVSQG